MFLFCTGKAQYADVTFDKETADGWLNTGTETGAAGNGIRYSDVGRDSTFVPATEKAAAGTARTIATAAAGNDAEETGWCEYTGANTSGKEAARAAELETAWRKLPAA